MEYRLEEIAEFQKGYAFKSKDYINSGICKIVKVSDLTKDSIEFSKCVSINESDYEKYEQFSLNKGDIIITTVGSWQYNPNSVVGKIVTVPDSSYKLLLNQNNVRLRAYRFVKQKFLYYSLIGSKFREYILNTAQGSANQASITQKDIKSFYINVPDVKYQKKIISIPNNIDKKIEINKKIIENLEAQAQAIFKSWFVDFEPFQDGNFVDSELGSIPEGWEVVKFGDLFKFQKGKKPKNLLDYNAEESVPYIVKGVIDGSERPSYTLEEKIIKIEDMDIFMLMDGANAGNIYYGYNGALGSTFSFLNIDDLEYREFIYWFLRTNEDYIRNQNTGSAIPHANKDFINNIRFALPKNISKLSILNYFKVIRTKVITLKQENQTLAQTRDTLLPKLMSGEIDVSNIKIDDEDIDYE